MDVQAGNRFCTTRRYSPFAASNLNQAQGKRLGIVAVKCRNPPPSDRPLISSVRPSGSGRNLSIVAVQMIDPQNQQESGFGRMRKRQTVAPSQYRQQIGEPHRIPLMLFDINASQRPISHKSSAGGSVTSPKAVGSRKFCYLSWAFPPRYRAVVCLENPRVRGSIPRLATSFLKTPALTGWRFAFRLRYAVERSAGVRWDSLSLLWRH